MLGAAVRNDTHTLEQLLQRPQDPNLEGVTGENPLYAAASRGHVESVHLLLEACADTERPSTREHNTPLYTACSEGHLEVVRLLLEAQAAPDAANMWNLTPIRAAFRGGHVEIARLLVERITNYQLGIVLWLLEVYIGKGKVSLTPPMPAVMPAAMPATRHRDQLSTRGRIQPPASAKRIAHKGCNSSNDRKGKKTIGLAIDRQQQI